MRSLRPLWLLLATLALTTLACQAVRQVAVTTPIPAPAVPTRISDAGPTATALSEPAATVTPPTPITRTPLAEGETLAATVTVLVDLNVRGGPGTQYDILTFLPEGASAPIVGRDAATGWWKIVCPPSAQGNECWLSGGAQFSRAANAGGVPVVAAPPTPTRRATATPEATATNAPAATAEAAATAAATAVATPVTPTTPVIVYVENGDVWLRAITPAGPTYVAGEPRRLTDRGDVVSALLAPNGRYVAYEGVRERAPYLGLVRTDGRGDRVWVANSALPAPAEGQVTAIGQRQWLPDSRGVAFVTEFVPVGPGRFPRDDFWTVSLGGRLQERLPADQGGRRFALSADNRVLLATEREVIRADVDGRNRDVVFTFPVVDTGSEYFYVPDSQWTSDGAEARLALSSPRPFDPAGPAATLWSIPTVGAATELRSITTNVLFNDVVWSASGRRLAYVGPLGDGPPRLFVGDGDGQGLTAVAAGERLRFFAWSPTEFNYLFVVESPADEEPGEAGLGIGVVGSTPIMAPVPGGLAVVDARWLDNIAFVYLQGSGANWAVRLGDLSGATAELFAMNAAGPPAFDVWSP